MNKPQDAQKLHTPHISLLQSGSFLFWNLLGYLSGPPMSWSESVLLLIAWRRCSELFLHPDRWVKRLCCQACCMTGRFMSTIARRSFLLSQSFETWKDRSVRFHATWALDFNLQRRHTLHNHSSKHLEPLCMVSLPQKAHEIKMSQAMATSAHLALHAWINSELLFLKLPVMAL